MLIKVKLLKFDKDHKCVIYYLDSNKNNLKADIASPSLYLMYKGFQYYNNRCEWLKERFIN